MSIRMLALELYRAKKRVEELEKNLKSETLSLSEKSDLEQELRKARAEETRIKSMLEGAKH
jgi:hypothetical protein